MENNESLDIKLLKLRIVKLIETEEYEFAERIKNWILEMNGNPDVSELIKNTDNKKQIKK
jgi:hypothetical protein